jgi:hypothetical protein
MRRGYLAALAGLLTSAALVQAQTPPVVPRPEGVLLIVDSAEDEPSKDVPSSSEPSREAPAAVVSGTGLLDVVGPEDVFWSAPPPPCSDPCPGCHERVWFNADYLLWWVRRGPIGAPLVTAGSPADAAPGALGQKNTAVLFGNDPADFGTFSGLRLTAGFALSGWWFVEGSYFVLERRAVGRMFSSDGNGNPVIARPFFDSQAGAQAAYLDSSPGLLTGGVAAGIHTRLQGYGANVAANVYHDTSFNVEVLAGFRALELDEDLFALDNVAALVPGRLFFLGGPADPPSSLTISDHFHNYNNFYGGQVGGRAQWRANGLELGVTGKIALGVTQQLAITDGGTTLNTPGGSPTLNAGGVLVQPSNTGRFFQSTFGCVPEFALDLGYWLSPLIRVALGYQFLYWNRVARPGNEIDTTINAAQVPRDPRFGNGLGDARPAFAFRQSDFWAQGLSFGVLFQY